MGDADSQLDKADAVISKLTRKILAKGAGAAAIKLLGSGLAYIMLVAVSRALDERQFGYFGAAFALASLVTPAALMGQHVTILRFLAQSGDVSHLRSVILWSLRACALGLAIAVGALTAFGTFMNGDWVLLAPAVAPLVVAMTAAEILSSVLRVSGSIVWALIPRDILWRLGVIGLASAAVALHFRIDAVSAILCTGGLLLLAVAPQVPALLSILRPADKNGTPPQGMARESLAIWGVTTLGTAIPHLTTLIVAVLLGPEEAAAVFAAERTANLVSIGLIGINQALAPEISRSYHTGSIGEVARMTSATAAASTAIALIGLVGFFLFGDIAVSLFGIGAAHTDAVTALLILSVGQLVNAASGPNAWLLQMTGKTPPLLAILVLANVFGALLLVPLTISFGIVGAAVALTMTMILWNVLATITARRQLLVDPSVLGLSGAFRSEE